jgi:hypothetical protein
MTIGEDVVQQDSDERAADLVLARLHLRLGSLGLARAELETMAGRNALDDQGIRDLAEVRWRTGDLAGAGDAAAAYLEGQPDDVLALIIAAEMQAHLGRPGEARRLAGRALAASTDPIDALFAGMPRSSVWPVDTGGPLEEAGTLFADLAAPAASWALSAGEAAAVDGSTDAEAGGGSSASEALGPGLWELHEEDHESTIAQGLPDPAELVSRARIALDADRPGQAAAALALALRAAPSLAPSVLELIAGRSEPVLALVRGDAHRIVGHEAEALRDYAASVAAIALERRSDDRAPDESTEEAEPLAPESLAEPDEPPTEEADEPSTESDPQTDPKEDS